MNSSPTAVDHQILNSDKKLSKLFVSTVSCSVQNDVNKEVYSISQAVQKAIFQFYSISIQCVTGFSGGSDIHLREMDPSNVGIIDAFVNFNLTKLKSKQSGHC